MSSVRRRRCYEHLEQHVGDGRTRKVLGTSVSAWLGVATEAHEKTNQGRDQTFHRASQTR